MGQKVNPIGYRIGVNKDWDSRWYAEKDYSTKLINDIKIREYIEKNLKSASISKVVIERRKNKVELTIYTARPGVIIGRGGEGITKLKILMIQVEVLSGTLAEISMLFPSVVFASFKAGIRSGSFTRPV